MRIKNQSKRRTSSQQAENKFSAYGEQVQKERRTSSKLAELRIKFLGDAQQKKFPCPTEKIPLGKRKNSLGQEKKFPWAREYPHSLIFVKWHGELVPFLVASLLYPPSSSFN